MCICIYIYIYIHTYTHIQHIRLNRRRQAEVEDAFERAGFKRLSALLRATSVRAYDDRAIGSFVRNSYVSTLCPVVICPYLCLSALHDLS